MDKLLLDNAIVNTCKSEMISNQNAIKKREKKIISFQHTLDAIKRTLDILTLFSLLILDIIG